MTSSAYITVAKTYEMACGQKISLFRFELGTFSWSACTLERCVVKYSGLLVNLYVK